MTDTSKSECRDFARGVCNRGSKCKFYHPPNGEPNVESKLPICKDFQNKGCDRMKCKFLHVTQKEEEEYNMTGILPEHGGRPEKVRSLGLMGGRGGHGGGGHGSGGHGGGLGNDVCKDFLNNICQRGNRCKFRHITEDQHQAEMGGGRGMYGKRRRDDYGGSDMMQMSDENEMLRRKITDLQRQVVDLRQMNDTLYDQNTRYRNQLRGVQPATLPPPTMNPYSTDARVAYPTSAAPVAADQLTSYDGYSKF